MFDAAGARVGGEILFNSWTEVPLDEPNITGLSGGGFVVTSPSARASLGIFDGKLQLSRSLVAKVDDEIAVGR